MAKGANQKKKLFCILELLTRESDELHPVTTERIIETLAANDISAERKSIYDDMQVLQELGYDVISCGRKGYYLGAREFELAELKLLVDAVQSSRFLSEKKSHELIKKLERFCSRHAAGKLQRQVHVIDRVKTMNESILYLVDTIHEAIGENRMISFRYLKWNGKKKLEPRHEGKRYLVSPYLLMWEEENYYLVAYDELAKDRRYYRVDKMADIVIEDEPRTHGEEFSESAALLSKKSFGMYEGAEERVRLSFAESLLGVVLDRFGTDVILIEKGEGQYEAAVDVQVSQQFFGWICGVSGVKICGPEHVAETYREHLKRQFENYE
ncbi:MAG: WYL domain-containing transcriptional regulator [Lachnospiraceae bacterium]|nr:WYL domain-containing transcriptional regulator [Lachnospiraceae bacterium]